MLLNASQTVSEVLQDMAHPDTVPQAVEQVVDKTADIWGGFIGWFGHNWGNLIAFGIILVLGWLLSIFIVFVMKKAMSRTNLDKSAISFICSISKYFLRFLAIIISLAPFGVSIGGVFAALGAAGIGLSLGLRESVANFASGVQIILTKPFVAGDYISINNVEGTVQRVEIMYSTLKTLEHNEVILPNSTLTAGTITNYTALGVRRATMDFSIQYGANIARIRKIVLDVANKHELVLEDPPPIFVVNAQAADGISCSLRVYTRPENYWTVFWDINEQIAITLWESGVRLPFAQHDIHIIPPEDVDRADSTKNTDTTTTQSSNTSISGSAAGELRALEKEMGDEIDNLNNQDLNS